MFQYRKPRYKIYLRLLEDIRNDFRLEKFNLLKWKKLKKRFKFQINKWSVFHYKGRICYFKKLKFVYNHLGLFAGSKRIVYELKKKKDNFDNSIFFYWLTQRLGKEFKKNLLNKQKLLLYYNIQNYKLKCLVNKELNKKDSNIKKKYSFINNLEKRLDNILYKAGFVKSIYQSRQLINHGKILVNKRRQSKVDYLVEVGDLIEFANLPLYYLKKNLLNNIKLKKRVKKKLKKKKKISLLSTKNFFQIKKNKKIFLKNEILFFQLSNFKLFQLNRKRLKFISKNQLKKPFFFQIYKLKLLKVLKVKKKITKLLIIRYLLYKLLIKKLKLDKKYFLKNKRYYFKNKKYFLNFFLKKLVFKKLIKKKLRKFIKKRKKLKFFFLYFFSNFLEINYKTLSILILMDIDIRKSFKFFLDLFSISNYYFHN